VVSERIDQTIKIAMLAAEEVSQNEPSCGSSLGAFKKRENDSGKKVTKGACKVHGISEKDLRGLPAFEWVGKDSTEQMQQHLGSSDAGTLAPHNGATITDFQSLAAELLRADLFSPLMSTSVWSLTNPTTIGVIIVVVMVTWLHMEPP
jgi:hypothetical protein